MALKIWLLVALAATVHAQLPGLGSCPDYKPIADFDIDQFLGDWYEYERYYSLFEVGTYCSKVTYSKAGDGKYNAANTVTTRLTTVTRVVNGDMKLVEPNTKLGKINIRYDQLPVPINSVYNVVATDYKNYAILWSCTTAVPFLVSSQNAWLMTRVREPSMTVVGEAIAHFERLGINRRFISRVQQTNCPADADSTPAVVAAPTAAPAAPDAAPLAALRNQQVFTKPEKNTVEVEEVKKEVIKDSEVAPSAEDVVKSEEAAATPEPEPTGAPEPEPTPAPDEDVVKAEKVEPEKVAEPAKVVDVKKE